MVDGCRDLQKLASVSLPTGGISSVTIAIGRRPEPHESARECSSYVRMYRALCPANPTISLFLVGLSTVFPRERAGFPKIYDCAARQRVARYFVPHGAQIQSALTSVDKFAKRTSGGASSLLFELWDSRKERNCPTITESTRRE